jgi:hypothetical protein
MTEKEVRDLLSAIIFVKVDNALPSPDHPSIQAAVDAIVERLPDLALSAEHQRIRENVEAARREIRNGLRRPGGFKLS